MRLVSKSERGLRGALALLCSILLIAPLFAPTRAVAADVFSVTPAKNGVADQTRSSLAWGAMTENQTKSDSIIISNTGDRTLSLFIQARFAYQNARGQSLISDTEAPAYDAAAWVTFGANKTATTSVNLQVGKSTVVPIQMTVPKGAFPGARLLAIVVAASLGTGTVTVAKRVALMSSITVPGSLKPVSVPSWAADSVFYEANVRNMSATRNFKGLTGRMSALKTLGIEALVLEPIFPIGTAKIVGTLGSVFAVTDFSKVNPSLGTDADFKAMLAAAKAAGIRVILTVPIDEVAIDHDWVSQKPNWFQRDKDYAIVPDAVDAFLGKLDYQQPDLDQDLFEDLKAWVNNYGIDGFVFSGATSVDQAVVDELCYKLQAIRPLLIGTTDAYSQKYFANSLMFNDNEALRLQLEDIDTGKLTPANFSDVLNTLNDYSNSEFSLNYVSNYTSMRGLKTETARMGASLPAAIALTFTLPGAASIFMGQEVGSIKALKPFDADSIVWPATNPATFTTHQRLIRLKKANPALFNGTGGDAIPVTSSSASILAFKRTVGKNTVLVVVNLSTKAVTAKINPGYAATVWTFTTSKSVKLTATAYSITVPARGYEIFTAAVVK